MAELGLRIGKISSINYEDGTARVTYEDRGECTTAELSFLAWEYQMPAVGDQVLVGHRSGGNVSAIILGRVWHSNHRPIEGKEGLYRKEFEHDQGVAFERYAEDEKKYTLTAGGLTIEMQGGEMTISGNVTVNGNVTVTGDLSVTGDIDCASNITAGGTIHSDGDTTAGSISLQSHTHTGVHGETSGPH